MPPRLPESSEECVRGAVDRAGLPDKESGQGWGQPQLQKETRTHATTGTGDPEGDGNSQRPPLCPSGSSQPCPLRARSVPPAWHHREGLPARAPTCSPSTHTEATGALVLLDLQGTALSSTSSHHTDLLFLRSATLGVPTAPGCPFSDLDTDSSRAMNPPCTLGTALQVQA